jgi:hypothetical protein
MEINQNQDLKPMAYEVIEPRHTSLVDGIRAFIQSIIKGKHSSIVLE